jgi:hypothetical protein
LNLFCKRHNKICYCKEKQDVVHACFSFRHFVQPSVIIHHVREQSKRCENVQIDFPMLL